jgi:hypothetical protein
MTAHTPPQTANALKITYERIDRLRSPNRTLRKHPERKIQKLEASIREFGLVLPVLVTAELEVVGGLALLEAARRCGYDEVPVILINGLLPVQIKALRLALNKHQEGSDWDREAVRLEFIEILDLQADFELRVTGFETAEIDLIIEQPVIGVTAVDGDDDSVGLSEEPPTSRAGDIWNLNGHLLACGDARDQALLDQLLGSAPIDMSFCDPPYNVPMDGHAVGKGATRHREFIMASGEMAPDEFATFLEEFLRELFKRLRAGGLAYVCMDWRSIDLLIRAGKAVGFDFINLIVWNKTNAGMGSLYRSQHELICLFRKPGSGHTNNVQLGKYGRNRSNVWDYHRHTPGS